MRLGSAAAIFTAVPGSRWPTRKARRRLGRRCAGPRLLERYRRKEIGDSLQSLKETGDWNEIRAEARSRSRSLVSEQDHRYRVLVGCPCRGKSRLKGPGRGVRPSIEPGWNRCRRPAPAPPDSTSPVRTTHDRAAVESCGERDRPPDCWRCSSLARVHNTSECCAIWLAGFLACKRPAALANEVARRAGTRIFQTGSIPRSPFDEPARRNLDLALRDTRVAQPALGAVSLGLLRILEDFGVRPGLTGGHSFGELTAACATAARIDDRELWRAILAEASRRSFMARRCGRKGPRG